MIVWLHISDASIYLRAFKYIALFRVWNKFTGRLYLNIKSERHRMLRRRKSRFKSTTGLEGSMCRSPRPTFPYSIDKKKLVESQAASIISSFLFLTRFTRMWILNFGRFSLNGILKGFDMNLDTFYPGNQDISLKVFFYLLLFFDGGNKRDVSFRHEWNFTRMHWIVHLSSIHPCYRAVDA